MLDKTLESPLDCKEIKLVNPRGNQPLIFIERTDAEAEAPTLWPPFARSQLIGKDPDAGQDWGREEKGYPLQYFGLENSMDCIVPGVAKSSKQLSDFKFQSQEYKFPRPNHYLVWSVTMINWTVNPKGNQSWIFIERTDAEAEATILWPPDEKNWLTGKDLDAGEKWRQEEKGTTEDEMVEWHHWLDGHEFE